MPWHAAPSFISISSREISVLARLVTYLIGFADKTHLLGMPACRQTRRCSGIYMSSPRQPNFSGTMIPLR